MLVGQSPLEISESDFSVIFLGSCLSLRATCQKFINLFKSLYDWMNEPFSRWNTFYFSLPQKRNLVEIPTRL